MSEKLNENGMKEARFKEILAAYGADPMRWPDAERSMALQSDASKKTSAEAREAAALDEFLNRLRENAASQADEAILARILTSFPKAPRSASPVVAFPPSSARPSTRKAAVAPPSWFDRRVMAAGLAAAAITGLAIGIGGASFGVPTSDASEELMISYALAEG